MQLPQKIQDRLHSGYDFHFSDYLSKGWALFRKDIWGFAGFSFLSLVIQMGLSIIPIIGYIGVMLVAAPLSVGYYLACSSIERREPHDFQVFFKGFEFLGPLALQYVIQLLVILGLFTPMVAGMFYGWDILEDDFSDLLNTKSWTMVFLVPIVYLGIAWRWAPLFVVFYQMNYWEAMETSRRLISLHWFPYFLFTLVTGAIYILGIFGLAVGLFFTYPLMMCMDYAAFSDVTQLMEKEEDDLADHLIG